MLQSMNRMGIHIIKEKSKGFPYSLPSVGHGADPSLHAVSQQVT